MSRNCLIMALMAGLQFSLTLSGDDQLAPWSEEVTIQSVDGEKERHSIHSYFNTCPESPDGRFVLYFTSTVEDGEFGEIRILERATGLVTPIATQITAEDAHRVACQQWANSGKTVVYHECDNGTWRVIAYDVASQSRKILAEDRQVGFGAANDSWVPIYGCHWNPGVHRDLELVHVETGEIRKPVTIEAVLDAYGDWVQGEFATDQISIFFPVMSPDGSKVFFKLARPSGGDDFRSKRASYRQGKVVYDLSKGKFIRLIEKWGHPSWSPDSTGIFEKGNTLLDVQSGRSQRYAPSSPTNHPSLSPDGNLFVTDADVSRRDFGKQDDWAIIVGSTLSDEFVVVDQFNNTHGALSWRRSHPHPIFSSDGNRIYYNVSEGKWTRLFVAQRLTSHE